MPTLGQTFPAGTQSKNTPSHGYQLAAKARRLMKFDNELLQSLPKALLHEHLDGVLRPRTVIELAKDANYQNLPVDDPQALAKWLSRGANQGSLAKYRAGLAHTTAGI